MNIVKILIELIFVIFTWIISILIIGFNSDYPFDKDVKWFLNATYYLVILFPIIYVATYLCRWKLKHKIKSKYYIIIFHFYFFYLLVVVFGTLLISSALR